MDYKQAKKCLTDIQIKECEPFFRANGMLLELGYCELLKDKLDEAKSTFTIIRDKDLRADWAYLLIQFMKNYIQFFPSYLQIRNFLEIDIGLLIKAGMNEYVENVVNSADIFYQINQESYKFIARALINYNYWEVAKIFLNKGVDRCYNDPELHFIYGNYHLRHGNKLLALHEFETSLEVLPNYFPAQKMIRELTE